MPFQEKHSAHRVAGSLHPGALAGVISGAKGERISAFCQSAVLARYKNAFSAAARYAFSA